MATAAVAATGATGLRVWLAARGRTWLSAGRLKAVTAVLILGAVVAAGVRV
jgi:hypothetical protein